MKGCGPGVAVLCPGLCNLSPAISPHTWTPDCSQRRSAQRMCLSKVGGVGGVGGALAWFMSYISGLAKYRRYIQRKQ